MAIHFATSLLMDRLNELQQQDQQQRQEAAVAEYKFVLKVLTTNGPKMKQLGFKTGKKAKLVVQRYLVEERGLFPDAD